MPDSIPHLKAAFATDSQTWVDADFTVARHLMVYEVTPTGADLLASGDRSSGGWAAFGGRGVLFTTGLSERAALELAAAGTFPVVLEQRRTIRTVLARLQTLMRRDPPLWMCRVLRYGVPRNDHL